MGWSAEGKNGKTGAKTDKAPTRTQTSRVSIPTHPLRAAKGRGWVGSETREAHEKAILSRRTSLFFPNTNGISSAFACHPDHDRNFGLGFLANDLVNADDAVANDIALRPIEPFGQVVELGPLLVVEPGGDGLDGNHKNGKGCRCPPRKVAGVEHNPRQPSLGERPPRGRHRTGRPARAEPCPVAAAG